MGKIKPKMEITNEDCVDLMARYPDNHFELAIVDPPYGIGADKKNSTNIKQTPNSACIGTNYGNQDWDSSIPKAEYFNELKRVSKKQIIWGGNYFGLIGGYLYWNKNVTMPTYSTGELAWLSWINKIDYFDFTWHGMLQDDMKKKEFRIHPTQKPVKLYKWLLENYAQPGDNILDTHMGSGSIAIACHYMGFDLTACELDKDYYDAAMKRIKEETAQLSFL